MSFRMSATAREAFLASVHVGVLSVERPDGPPLATPVWYRYAVGGAVEFLSPPQTVKSGLLRTAGRATLVAQDEAPPFAYVTVDGPVEIPGLADEETIRDIARRYLGEAGAVRYLEANAGRAELLVRLTPARWFSADFGRRRD